MRMETLEDLSDKLQAELSWRKNELFKLKTFMASSDVLKTILLRSALSLLSAHFEGFVREASGFYLLYVSAQKIKCQMLSGNFAVILLDTYFRKCKTTNKNSPRVNLIDSYQNIQNTVFLIREKELSQIISMHSNPKMDVLDDLLSILGIESDIFRLKKRYIEENLLRNRHKIVHGERYPVQYTDFIEILDKIVGLMDDYNDLILKSAEDQCYIKKG